jgi:hypothetical protein
MNTSRSLSTRGQKGLELVLTGLGGHASRDTEPTEIINFGEDKDPSNNSPLRVLSRLVAVEPRLVTRNLIISIS